MASINVNRSVSDRFYRYKMPPLIAKIEGKGNGIKTVIVNMSEIGKCLSRPPTYLTKYFGCEFGAQTKCDAKNDRYIVNGAHDGSKLQEVLDGFIKRFVLCTECGNPETELQINGKRQLINMSCKACGHVGTLDNHHKLIAFILKNPFDDTSAYNTSTAVSNNEDKVKQRSVGKNTNEENGHVGENAEDTIPNFGGLVINNGSNGNNTKQKSKNGMANGDYVKNSCNGENDDYEAWSDTEETNDSLMNDNNNKNNTNVGTKTGKNGNINNNQNQEITATQSPIDVFYHYVKKLKESGEFSALPKNGNNNLDKEIYGEADKLDVKDKAPMVLAELLFDSDLLNQITRFRTIFLRFCHGNPRAQKYLLGAFEQLIGSEYKSALLPKVAHVLKAAYDADLLDEETLIDWSSKVSKKYVDKETATEIRKKAEPFITWLREAESEGSSSESGPEENGNNESSGDYAEESDEEEDIRDKHVKRGGLLLTNAQNGNVNKTTDKKEENESDLDIDAI